jgi:hypothetical protein
MAEAAMVGSYHIVPALDEATRTEAYRLRYQVFVEDLGEPIASATAEEGVVEEDDQTGQVLLAYDGDQLVGTIAADWWKQAEIAPAKCRGLELERFAQSFSRDGIFLVRKAVVVPSHRKTMVFRDLIGGVCDFILKTPSPRFVFLSCRPELSRLYERLGFRCYAPHFSLLPSRASIPMCLVINDHDYLARVRSPILEPIKGHGHPHIPEIARYFAEQWDPGLRAAESDQALPEFFDPHSEEHATLAESALLRGLVAEDVRRFLSSGRKVQFERDQPVIAAGDSSTDLFLIARGHVEVTIARDGRRIVVATLGPGEVFGEMNMLLRSGRSSDVVALTSVEALRVSESAFRTHFASDPATLAAVNLNLAGILARRLQVTTSLVS